MREKSAVKKAIELSKKNQKGYYVCYWPEEEDRKGSEYHVYGEMSPELDIMSDANLIAYVNQSRVEY